MSKASSNYDIQPLLPPRLDQGMPYQTYLASYDMYVAKIQEIRAQANAAREATRIARVAEREKKGQTSAKPTPQPPALSAETRGRIGKAFSEGKKFGSLDFSKEELAAASKRWQALCTRGRARLSRGLNGRERAELIRIRPIAAKGSEALASVDTWEKDLLPELKSIYRAVGIKPEQEPMGPTGYPNTISSTARRLDGNVIDPSSGALTFTKRSAMAVAARFQEIAEERKTLEQEVKKLRPLAARSQEHLAAQIAKLKAEAELARSESSLKGAQTETQRRRAQLKKTVVERVSAHVIPSSSGMAPQVVMVPETTSTVESTIDAPAAAVEVQPRAKLPISIVDLDRDSRQSQGNVIGKSFFISDVSQTQREIRRQGRLLASEGGW